MCLLMVSSPWIGRSQAVGTEIPHKADIFEKLYPQWKDNSLGEIRELVCLFCDVQQPPQEDTNNDLYTNHSRLKIQKADRITQRNQQTHNKI